MFDFAISQNKRRRPTRRIFTSWIASGLIHLIMLLLLIQYPQLLRGGMYHRFRPISLIANILGPNSDDEEQNWRTVTVLRNSSSMTAPSAATLKKYLFDWNKKESSSPPIRVRWGDVEAALADLPPMPRVRKEAKEPKLSLPANPLSSAGSDTSSGSEGAGSGSPAAVQAELSSGKKGTITLPPPDKEPKTEVVSNNPPNKIPDSIKPLPHAAPPAASSVKVFEDEQKAIRSPDSGFFDTKGFPLGDYTNLIVERIKGKWMIPSNLRNSQGHTTVIFYIDKSGRFMNARIVMSSGSNSLDLAALNAVIESNPFPPLPEGFPGDHVGAKFIFSYNEPQ